MDPIKFNHELSEWNPLVASGMSTERADNITDTLTSLLVKGESDNSLLQLIENAINAYANDHTQAIAIAMTCGAIVTTIIEETRKRQAIRHLRNILQNSEKNSEKNFFI